MVKRNRFLVRSYIISIGLILLQIPVSAAVLAQSVSEQKQQPSHPLNNIDRLFANLPGSKVKINCATGTNDNNGLTYRVAFYQWDRTDDVLILSVDSERKNLSYCVSLAFEELRYAAFKLGINPPSIELFYGNIDEHKNLNLKDMYVCSVPAKISENDHNVGRFEDHCSLDLFDF